MPNALSDKHKISPSEKGAAEKPSDDMTAETPTEMPEEMPGETPGEMPDWLPKKFWDAEKGEIRVRALVKSYRSLEKRLSSAASDNSNNRSGDVSVDKPEPEKTSPAKTSPGETSVEKPTEESADVVADELSGDTEVLLELRAAAAEEALSQAFGGVDKWRKLQPRLVSWGRRNLPPEAYESLSASVAGIKQLYNLMQSAATEPQMVGGGEVPQAPDESRLRRMMQDPRYWRDRDPEFVNRVLSGFRQLYDN